MSTTPHSLYCMDCDLIYDEYVERCPHCKGEVIPWDEAYLQSDPRQGEIKKGIAIGFGAHVLQLFILAIAGWENIWAIGISQLLYLLPLMIIYGVKGKGRTVAGLAVAGGLTFAANVAFFGILCAGYLGGGWY